MKKSLFLILLLTGIGSTVFAQGSFPVYDYTGYTMTDFRFNSVRPGYARVLFSFRMPPSKTWIQLELTTLQQLNQLPNLDSLLAQSLLAIKGVVDSTPMDNIARRIDAVPRDQKVEIRTTSHESNQNTLVYQQGSLSNLKIERDTLRITFYTGDVNDIKRQMPGFLTVQVNFLQDLYALPLHVMDSCIVLARKHFTEELVKGIGWRERVTATFDLSQGLMISPSLPRLKAF
ncbi:MAG: hypothetical protein ACK57C_07800 [Bacteroidota bacterium]